MQLTNSNSAGRGAVSLRGWLATFLWCVALLQPASLLAQMPEHFEGTRWYDFRPGFSQPKDLTGNLVVNARDEKLVFFWQHRKMLEADFVDLGGMFYEHAAQPSKVTMPPKGWRRLRGKRPRHLLTIMVRKNQPGRARPGQEAAQDSLIFPVLFELPEDQFGEVLLALESALGRPVQRIETSAAAN